LGPMIDGTLSTGAGLGASTIGGENGFAGSAIAGGVFSRANAGARIGTDLCAESKVAFHTPNRIATKAIMITIIRIAHDKANDVPIMNQEATLQSSQKVPSRAGNGTDVGTKESS
jgi:hypothetical protein